MAAEASQRASPDALLALASREGRGRIKIFLGAAPGVGKTYAMLTAARSARDDGRDVAVGLVETHGRNETEAMVRGLDMIPRKPIVYRNQVMQEFDLDAALARRPGLLLVDEYAHTNVPGSRHPKRWQDIDELLAAGIDVWTTLNIQHLESLNDLIQKITKVRVRETVPDTIFDHADELVLVDLPPDELLRRLAEGRIYIQDTAKRAVESFFKPQNLTALRELALRRAAERVDADLVGRMQAQAIEGPWAAGERILACVGSDDAATTIVRKAKRLADLMDAPWIVVTVERPGIHLDIDRRRRIDETLRLAETLGAETRTLAANDLPDELLRFSRFENVTQIVVGRSRRGFLTEFFHRSLPHELIRRANDIAVHVVTGHNDVGADNGWTGLLRPRRPAIELLPYLISTICVVTATAIGKLLTLFTPFPNLSMVYLVAVLLPALAFGIGPAIYASFVSFIAYNFFLIEPVYTFTIAEPYELLALVIFLIVAVITSALGGRVRMQARIAANRVKAMRRLYEFTRRLSGLASIDEVAEGAVSEIHASLGLPAIILLHQDGELALRAAWPPEDTLDAATQSAARWAFDHNEPAGSRTTTLPLTPWLFVPLQTSRGPVGVVGLAPQGGGALDPETRVLFDALADQAAAALERASLARDMVSARTAVAAEQVRNTVLASISHDFRTPLASILGSATSLLEFGDKLADSARTDLLLQIKQEVEQLDGMVRNLLSMTRIEAGALELRIDWVDLREIVDRTISKARRRAHQTFESKIPADLPMVRADATLVEQAINNVIGNVIVHTPGDTVVVVDAEVSSGSIVLCVTDNGPGIPADLLPHVLEKFVRSREATGSPSGRGEGTGLGLAIAKGIMDAHGGSIAIKSPVLANRGTRIVLSFAREKAHE